MKTMDENIRWSMPINEFGSREPTPVWPEGWSIPNIGHSVVLSNQKDLKVTAVDWFPHGEDGSDPFVYIVLREHRIGDR